MSSLRWVLSLAFAGLWGYALPVLAAAPKSAPNVVFITIDTLRADHLGCYGYRQVRTPNIDSLAGESARFTRAFTPVPVTLPAHTVIFTGTYPMRSGMHDFSANRLGDTQPTLATILKEHGYRTAAVVGSAVLDSRFGLNRGFDFYFDHFDFNRLQESNLDEMERPGNVVADTVLDWLAKNDRAPFFLWMHLYDPHYPYTPPEPYRSQYQSHPYDGEIAFADAQAGRLLQFLKDKRLYDNTLIVLSGDHGESLGEHGEKTHGFFIYNATMHVPLLIHLPGRGKQQTVSQVVSLADLVPTVLAALQMDVPPVVQGRSLLPAIAGKTEPGAAAYGETFLPRLHFNWSELRGVETDAYHFIDAPRPELYDLAKDPGENTNLIAQKKAVGEEMRNKLLEMIQRYGSGEELAAKTGLDPALMERLKSLGYAGFSGGGSPTISNRNLPDPKDRVQAYELISDAVAESQHGQYQSSNEKLKAALATEPNSVPVHYLMGLNYYRQKDYAGAVTEFQTVLRLSPDYSLAVYQLGLSYGQNHQLDEAIATLKHALELDATNFDAAYNLGAAYLMQQNGAEAAAAFEQSVSISPDFARGHAALGRVRLYLGQVDDAIAELRRAVELAPDSADFHKALAEALRAKGLNAEADEEMRKAGAPAR